MQAEVADKKGSVAEVMKGVRRAALSFVVAEGSGCIQAFDIHVVLFCPNTMSTEIRHVDIHVTLIREMTPSTYPATDSHVL